VNAAYSGDAVYLYSTADEPESEDASSPSPSPILSSNAKRRKIDGDGIVKISPDIDDGNQVEVEVVQLPPRSTDSADSSSNIDEDMQSNDGDNGEEDSNEDEDYIDFIDIDEIDEADFQPYVPMVMPRRRFVGARNVDTIKDGE
jgi:hypothetical protein